MSWHLLDAGLAVCLAHLPTSVLADVPHERFEFEGLPITAVPHQWEAVATLRSRGLPVPSMATRYHWPGRFAPRQNQRQTVEFLLDHPRAAVLNEVRTGKTLSAIWAMDILMRAGQVRRALIVAPKSILHSVWSRELMFTIPARTHVVLEGDRKRKRQAAADPRVQVLVVNPESLTLLDGLPEGVDLVVVDEATKFKSDKAQRTKALAALTLDTRLWLMTGTPAPQAPTDAYSLIKLLRRGRYVSFRQFRWATMTQWDRFKWLPRPDAAAHVFRELQPAIRFRAEDCYDVPEETVIDRAVDLTPAQRRAVETLQREAFAAIAEKKVLAANAAVALSKCLQVMAGGVYGAEEDGETPAYEVDATPFFDAVFDIVEEAEGPVLVFAPFRITAAMVHARALAAGLRSAAIMAGTSSRERMDTFDRVQRGDLDVLVAIPQTVAHGLDLSASNTIVWLSPPFSFETYAQANARISGSGQTRKRVIYRLVQNKLASALYRRLDDRRTLQDAILELIEGDTNA